VEKISHFSIPTLERFLIVFFAHDELQIDWSEASV